MRSAGIHFVLVHVDEAHSRRWPIGNDPPEPHASLDARIARARAFVEAERPDPAAFTVVVDAWSNDFAEAFHAWPDAYYVLDPARVVLAKSSYDGTRGDAVVDVDCVDLIERMIEGGVGGESPVD